MIPIYQTRFGDEGNCHAACLASIFEVPIGHVPQPTKEELASPEGWETYHERVNREFLKPKGFYESRFAPYTPEGQVHAPPGFSILCIASAGAIGAHSVVCLDGEIVHDPNPHSLPMEGEKIELLDWTTFGVLDPTLALALVSKGAK